MADEEFFYADGINATSGYMLERAAPLAVAEAAKRALAETDEVEKHLTQMRAERDASGEHFGVAAHIDAGNLAHTGWGVIFPSVTPGAEAKRQEAIREALKPLLDHRKRQVNNELFYQEFDGERACEPTDTNQSFFDRLDGHDPGAPADPATGVPYYLLLVGSPSEISFSFQYQLDITYAVGRVHFEKPDGSPDLDAYYNYARSVVEAETRPLALSRELAFFAVRNPNDKATEISRLQLVPALSDWLEKARELQGWKFPRHYDDAARKATLTRLVGGGETPALLFTASHGMSFDLGDNRQTRHGGALLCSDWVNPRPFVPVTEDLYFSCDDIASDARLHGLIAFNFACYGGGTPDENEYAHMAPGKGTRIAERPFIARLPQRLLGHPKGGALAAIGHIERAWSDSVPTAKGAANRIGVFTSALFDLMKGKPVGLAMEYFNQRYAQLGADMASEIQKLEKGKDEAAVKRKKAEFARKWTMHNDARDYVVNGDPAVRLNFGETEGAGKGKEREVLVLSAFAGVAGVASESAPALATAAPKDAATDAPAAESFDFMDHFRNKPEPAAAPAATDDVPEITEVEEVKETELSPVLRLASVVADMLDKTLRDMSELRVQTFVSNTPAATDPTKAPPGVVQLRAWTRIELDGDIDVCVPQIDGQVDTAIWELHKDMVKQAQEHRAEMIKLLVASIPGLGKR
jgi:hypothetical protein